ncbi:Rpn family recombination-promoting nuclease/putative transposase [Azospirillum halopraeferens]|uniref:Rpn family recombination-promoting nuclease/putative transposase n=1 Tax=Azospirillum halopraeferens TaxID=34010 RepID=UPI000414F5B5|nr:Rpn family recombination-promoting nuclease/putative transposase [Azospirillum halopraeferens]
MSGQLIRRHDQFFKRLLDQPGAAGALLRERLPPAITARLSDDPPELLHGSFISEDLAEFRTDRLYRASTRAGVTALIHVVVEHKSAPDPRVALQLLGYKSRILHWWDARRKVDDDGEPVALPVVVSMVVYHGAAPWRVPLSLGGIIAADPDLLPYAPDFRYSLVDLGRIADTQLSQEPVLRVGFLILKHGTRGEDLRRTLLTLGPAAYALGFDELVALMRYVLREPNDVEAGVVRDVLAEIVPGQEERVMSIALEQFEKQWKAEAFKHGWDQGRADGKAEGKSEGKAEGIALGEIEGRAASLSRLLERRFGKVPPAVRDRIRTASLAELDAWFDAAIDAPALEEVFRAGH